MNHIWQVVTLPGESCNKHTNQNQKVARWSLELRKSLIFWLVQETQTLMHVTIPYISLKKHEDIYCTLERKESRKILSYLVWIYPKNRAFFPTHICLVWKLQAKLLIVPQLITKVISFFHVPINIYIWKYLKMKYWQSILLVQRQHNVTHTANTFNKYKSIHQLNYLWYRAIVRSFKLDLLSITYFKL